MAERPPTVTERAVNALARVVLGLALYLPYRARVSSFGWIFARLVAPLAGWRRRVESNLALALPEFSRSERASLAQKVPDNVGRALIELYSGEEFLRHIEDSPIGGPGLAALEAAHKAGTPAVLVTAHLGSYDAARGALYRRGYPIAGLYKPMTNKAFNEHYLRAMSIIGEPLFATDRRGIVGLVKHLKAGGMIGILADVGSTNAPVLSFFGRSAHTPLSAAEWAIQYEALMVPIFGIRQPDGLSFSVRVEAPIPSGTPQDMMQRYNDVVEAAIRDHPEQWFWIHNRWKLGPGVPEKPAEEA